jgi:hypothetical protein
MGEAGDRGQRAMRDSVAGRLLHLAAGVVEPVVRSGRKPARRRPPDPGGADVFHPATSVTNI